MFDFYSLDARDHREFRSEVSVQAGYCDCSLLLGLEFVLHFCQNID
jgi:hypothetical protein